jgi:hypothetical protein
MAGTAITLPFTFSTFNIKLTAKKKKKKKFVFLLTRTPATEILKFWCLFLSVANQNFRI